MPATLTDLVALGLSAALLAVYHLFLYIRLRRHPHYTTQAVNRSARTAWALHVMGDESRSILAVQTLRNSTMAATFLASTAVLLMMGTLTLTGQADKLSGVWHALNLFGPASPGMWLTKVLLLVTDFFVAFLCFSTAVRLFNHVGYQLNMPKEARTGPHEPRYVAELLNRAGHVYTLGMRAYYFAVPLVFWLFGPHFILAASIVLVFVLYNNDHAPRVKDGEKATR